MKAGIDRTVAADLLWTLASLRLREDLVLLRHWSVERYREHVTAMILRTLTDIRKQESTRTIDGLAPALSEVQDRTHASSGAPGVRGRVD